MGFITIFSPPFGRIQVWDCNIRDAWTRKTGRSSNGGGSIFFESQHIFSCCWFFVCWRGYDGPHIYRNWKIWYDTRWWCHFFKFAPLFGEDSHFDSYFSNGLVQPPTRYISNQQHPTNTLGCNLIRHPNWKVQVCGGFTMCFRIFTPYYIYSLHKCFNCDKHMFVPLGWFSTTKRIYRVYEGITIQS